MITLTSKQCIVHEPDVHGLEAQVTDARLRAFPADPEHSTLVITLISRDAPGEVLDGHVFEGREGLIQWYETSVGYNPDAGREQPMPILVLLDLVASMLLLYEWDRTTTSS